MTRKIILWLYLLAFTVIVHGQHEINKDEFFRLLKEFKFEQAEMAAGKITDPNWRKAMILLSQILYEAGQKKHLDFQNDSTSIAFLEPFLQSSSDGQALIKLLWGFHFFYSDPYTEKPIDHFTQAYQLAREKGISEELKFSVYSIIVMYNWQLSQTNDEIVQYLDMHEKLIQDESDQFHNRMGRFIYELKDETMIVNLTEENVNEFRQLMSGFGSDHHFWIEFNITLGVYRKYLGFKNNDNKSVNEGKKLLVAATEHMGNEPYLRYLNFRAFTQLSQIAAYQGDFQTGMQYVTQAQKYGYINDTIRTQYHLNWYSAPNLFGLGKTDSAYLAMTKAASLKSLLGIQENNLHTSHYQWKFQTKEKEKRLLAQEKQLLLEKESKAQSRTIAIILGIILVLGAVISILIYRDSKRKRLLAIQDKNIQSEKVTNLLKGQELIALNAMIEGQETERKRIAEDLHDRLGSTLSAVKMHIEVLSEGDARYDKVNSIVNKAVNDTREIAHNMLSGVLTNFGLLAALQDLKETVESAKQIQVKLSRIQFDERLESDMEIHIYRIIQELIGNTLKHARATQVKLELRKTPDQKLIITYQDNGIGFNPEEVSVGMGLKNIKNRVDKIRGTWKMNSSPMKGVEVIIELWKKGSSET